jgi:uncharacterized membrane protein
MTAPNADQLTREYLARIEVALATVAPARREELMNEVRAHIAEARGELANETDADVMNILERLGDPAEMAAAETERVESISPIRRPSRALEVAAVVLLVLFWPVGVVLLWLSDAWTTRDKLIGTLVPPGGYLGAVLVGAFLFWGAITPVCSTITDDAGNVLSSTCPSGAVQITFDMVSLLFAVLYVIGPILTAGYLAFRRNGCRAESTDALAGSPMVGAG